MANADRIIPEPVEGTVTLTLTDTEARHLRTVLAHVGGDSDTTGRGHISNIIDAMDAVGVEGDGRRAVTGAIYFRNADGSVNQWAPRSHLTEGR